MCTDASKESCALLHGKYSYLSVLNDEGDYEGSCRTSLKRRLEVSNLGLETCNVLRDVSFRSVLQLLVITLGLLELLLQLFGALIRNLHPTPVHQLFCRHPVLVKF
eukprot:m.441886 g.441886  ORF g.441886 m.441886 type:complete len:106 (+) comp18720_c0_seq1:143-460(+)